MQDAEPKHRASPTLDVGSRDGRDLKRGRSEQVLPKSHFEIPTGSVWLWVWLVLSVLFVMGAEQELPRRSGFNPSRMGISVLPFVVSRPTCVVWQEGGGGAATCQGWRGDGQSPFVRMLIPRIDKGLSNLMWL